VRVRKPASESNDLVLSVSMLAQPAKKMVPQAASARIKLELTILIFIVRCVVIACNP
jgi:hypothetical protein